MTSVTLEGRRFEIHLTDLDDELMLTEEEAIRAYELLTSLREKREARSLLQKIAQ